MPAARDWRGMRGQIERQLVRQTGTDLEEWNRRVRGTGIRDPDRLQRWLTAQGVTGYPRMLLGMERFGYPDFLLATAEQLVEGQFAGRPRLRAVYDEVIRRVGELPGVEVQARKTYVSLLGPKRTFARLQRKGPDAIALALRLDRRPGGLLTASRVHESMPVELTLRSASDLTPAALDLVREALAGS